MSVLLAPAAPPEPARVATLLEALPYMRAFHGQTMVVCTGGTALDSPESLARVARDIALLKYVGIAPVVVHAGGIALDRALRRFGFDAAAPGAPNAGEVTKMVLLGKVNKDVVGALHAAGQRAFGIGGDDGGLITAGDEMRVDASVLRCLPAHYIPVIAAVATSARGEPVPMDVDALGHLVALAIGAAKLIFIADLEAAEASSRLGLGGRRRGPASAFRPLVATLPGPLAGVLASCCEAVERGVPAAHVVDARQPHTLLLELFTDEGTGLKVMPEPGAVPTPERSDDGTA
jgi:acetylglutamate kinase